MVSIHYKFHNFRKITIKRIFIDLIDSEESIIIANNCNCTCIFLLK